MTRRVIANILADAELLDSCYQGDPAVMARYGADLLGRAIGHENQAAAGSLTGLHGYHPIIAETTGNAAHRAMVIMAAREV